MPPPPSYLDITPIPYSRAVTPAEFNAGTFGGVIRETWFRFVTAVQIALGGYCTATPAGFDFVAVTRVYASDGSTLLHTISPGGAESNGWFFVFAAGTYYVRINNQYATNIANSFTVTHDTRPVLLGTDVAAGSLVVNDDTSGFPATVVTPAGAIQGVLTAIPAGETGAVLPSGASLWHDRFGVIHATNRLAIFDTTLTYVASVDLTTPLGGALPLISHDSTQFYVYHPTDRKIYRITTAGVVTTATSALPVSTKLALGVNRAGSVAYYALGQTDGIIYRYDITNDLPLTNFYAIAGWAAGSDRLAYTLNNFPGEILSLADDTIVTWWRDLSATTTHLLVFNPAGTLLHDFSYTDAVEGWIDHLTYGITDLTGTVTGWFQDIAFRSYGTYVTISLTDGTRTTIRPQDIHFESGVALIEGIPTLFSPSQSCLVISYLTFVEPPSDNEIICIHGSAHGTLGLTGSYARAIGRVVV